MDFVNAFVGNKKQPTDRELSAALGEAQALWDELLAALAREHAFEMQEWSSYSAKAGWSLRLKLKKRTILYLLPARGGFRAAFVLGDKAVEAARQAKLPRPILKLIDAAPRYAEGIGFRLEIKSAADMNIVEKLAALKRAN